MNSQIQMVDRNVVRSINNGKPNILRRVSISFHKKMNFINKIRTSEEHNLNRLSDPKITELIIRHKLWSKIQEDIINYLLDEGEEE